MVGDTRYGEVITILNTGVFSFTPNTPVAFGIQVMGATSAKAVTLTNTGKVTIAISSMSTSKPFGVTSTCGTSVAPGAQCALNVTFSPVSKGPMSSTITIHDGASSKPQVIELNGTGTAVELSTKSLTFPPQKVGSRSAPQNVHVTNTSGTTLNFSSIVITAFNHNYEQSNNCGSALAAHASCTVAVTFTPTQTGKLTANLILTDDGGASPQLVSLTGTGD